MAIWLVLLLGALLTFPFAYLTYGTPLHHVVFYGPLSFALAILINWLWVRLRHGREAAKSAFFITDEIDRIDRRRWLQERRRALEAEQEASRSQATPSPSEPKPPSGPSSH